MSGQVIYSPIVVVASSYVRQLIQISCFVYTVNLHALLHVFACRCACAALDVSGQKYPREYPTVLFIGLWPHSCPKVIIILACLIICQIMIYYVPPSHNVSHAGIMYPSYSMYLLGTKSR